MKFKSKKANERTQKVTPGNEKMMMNKFIQKTITLLTIFVLLMLPLSSFAQKTALDRTAPSLPVFDLSRGRGGETDETLTKLAPELRTLYAQFATTRGGTARGADESGMEGFTKNQLSEIFGITGADENPLITISVKFTKVADIEIVKKAGASILSKTDKTVYALIPVQNLINLAGVANVQKIGVFKAMSVPTRPKEDLPPELTFLSRGGGETTPTVKKVPLANEFNKSGFTGKGVIVGVIDSGIDWKHADFIRADGTSRIVALWDLSDNSYQKSGGSTGSKPPVYIEDKKTWLGTVYTNEQINAALKGKGTIGSYDRFGHGTAVAGTAAGNGRATKDGVPNPSLAGVAPDADLIIVKAMDCGFFIPSAELTAEWMTDKAKELKKPIVINMSFGGQFSGHDGTTDGEQFIDQISGKGKPGIAVTVAAGNDGRFNVHAAGKFGAKREGQADVYSSAIDLFVKEPAHLLGIFNPKDDWGVVFKSSNAAFLGIDDKAMAVFLYKTAGGLAYKTSVAPKNLDQFKSFLKSLEMGVGNAEVKTDSLQIQVPPGDFIWWGYGTSPNVTEGKFDLYITDGGSSKASFGTGVAKNGIVGSPGNAANAITVGSYDFRTTWENSTGQTTFYNLQTGGISDYSSMGFRRDGAVKPEIAAPARYTIASLSSFARPANGGCEGSMATGQEVNFTSDGYHVAWAGTSAAAPFTAGVIALMLQKNPTLDADQIKQILQKTARKDGLVGAVPNAAWGFGMIDPAAALLATPTAKKALPVVKKPVKK